MASTTALFTGLAGLNANARQLDVIGNNISNVNTTAFKSNRLQFSSAFNRTFSLGTSPNAATGGSNPGQIGLGVTMAGTQRNFSNGAISPTGLNTDLAIEGNGFFVVERGSERFFTRAGAFQFNSQNDLVTLSGDRLQGYPIDSQFNVIEGRIEDVNIPLGTLTIAEATQNVTFSGNLNADGDVAVQGSVISLGAFSTGGVPPTPATLMTDLDPAGNFVVGNIIELRNAERGGKVIPTAQFEITAGSTLADYMTWLRFNLGIYENGGSEAGDPAGVSTDGSVSLGGPGGDEIIIVGNPGSINDLDIDTSDLFVLQGSAATPPANATPFATIKSQSADGESVRTTFIVYDSLGTELQVDLTLVLAAKTGGGTFWRPFLHSPDDTDDANLLENGVLGAPGTENMRLLQFDNFGQLATLGQYNIQVDRENTGALNPLQIALRFNSDSDQVSALSNTGGGSTIAAVFQDGSPLGVLSSFSVGENGTITGGFTNGLTRTIGRLALASFTNPEGLVDAGNNLFAVGPNSGTALITEPLQFGTGRVIGGALELSNVDLSQEFINMILTSTGYSAASRVVTTTNELMNQLLVLGR